VASFLLFLDDLYGLPCLSILKLLIEFPKQVFNISNQIYLYLLNTVCVTETWDPEF